MAYEGELVKMENGRWARFQRCPIFNSGHPDHDDVSVLVAVELDSHYQDLLSAAEGSLDTYRQRGIPVRVRIDPESEGKISLSVDRESAAPQ